MRILFTFEYPELMLRAEDYIRLLLHFGHEVSLYGMGDITQSNWMRNSIKHERFIVCYKCPNVNEFDAWYYDLTSAEWRYPSEFASRLVSFKGGFVACINYEDGYSFFDDRVTNAVKEKTCLFMNNAIYKDREKYEKRLREKLFLTTSYISNSQSFKHGYVPYKHKQKCVMFSGSVTGNATILTNYKKEEEKLRIFLAMKIYDEKRIPSIIRFAGFDPSFKHYYDEIPEHLKQNFKSRSEFVDELKRSSTTLSIKGNSYPTNRFFEALAAGCLSLSTKMDGEVEVYGIGKPGVDYVEINVDGSDLIEKIDYYFNHENEAEKIAESGRKTWEKYNMLSDDGIYSSETLLYHVEGIKRITGFDIRTL